MNDATSSGPPSPPAFSFTTPGDDEKEGDANTAAATDAASDTDADADVVPLHVLFAKPTRDQVRLSPRSTYLGWRERDPKSGVLNLWAKRRRRRRKRLPHEEKSEQDQDKEEGDDGGDDDDDDDDDDDEARQMTCYTDRDACLLYIFSSDDRTMLYLRETTRGSERYHLHAVDLDDDSDDNSSNYDGNINKQPRPRNLTPSLNTSVAVGFIGSIQLWHHPSPSKPRSILTSITDHAGTPRALFWDACDIDIDTGQRTMLEVNELSTAGGMVRFTIRTVVYVVVRFLVEVVLRRLFGDGADSKCFGGGGGTNDEGGEGVTGTGRRHKQRWWWVPNPPRATIQWFPDRRGNFAGKVQVNPMNLGAAWCVRDDDDDDDGDVNKNKWKVLHEVEWDDINMQLIGSAGGTGTARMDFSSSKTKSSTTVDVHLCNVNGSNTTSYERYDVRTGERLWSSSSASSSAVGGSLARRNECDLTGFVVHPKSGRVQAVEYEYDKPTLECLPPLHDGDDDDDGGISSDVEYLHHAFPGMVYSIASRTFDDDAWIVYAERDSGNDICAGGPSGYFLYDRLRRRRRQQRSTHEEHLAAGDGGNTMSSSSSSSLRFIFAPRPELARYRLGAMRPVHIRARDGEDLLCYLSTPPGWVDPSTASASSPSSEEERRRRRPRALVVMVHGGPQARDSWRYNSLCQLLCSRGMSVLQVNYRGSTGFGWRFMRLGMNGAFATKLQHDITDAALHAVSSGWADRDRMAILGGSFGGYSSLWGMTFQPGLYRCAVAICPLSVVGAANPSKAFHGSPLVARYWRRVFGDAVSDDRAAAEAVSPLHHVRNVSAPILLVHGENDPRAPREHSDKFAEEMRQRHIPGEYISFADEGHGIAAEKNVLYMYSRVETFLCKYLSLAAPPPVEGKWTDGNTANVHMLGEDSSAASGGLGGGVDYGSIVSNAKPKIA